MVIVILTVSLFIWVVASMGVTTFCGVLSIQQKESGIKIMRIAIISDIHGNYEALFSVHKDIEKSEVDKIICLGDFIGYGPQL